MVRCQCGVILGPFNYCILPSMVVLSGFWENQAMERDMTDLTSAALRESAAAKDQQAADSWERCDTDGFVSQWANNINASLDRRKADLIDEGKLARFKGLYDGDRRVKAKQIETKFGFAWLLHDDEADLIARRGKKFLPTGKRSRILKKLGLSERTELAPAWACLTGSGSGLSGCASVHVATFRTGCKWGSDAKLINEEEGKRNG
jgi:hypothetical protein